MYLLSEEEEEEEKFASPHVKKKYNNNLWKKVPIEKKQTGRTPTKSPPP